jgi:hypothetical protein
MITIGGHDRPAGPRNARTDPDSGLRFYTWKGRQLPSVTTIRRMAGLPWGLHQWTINQVVARAITGIANDYARLSSGDDGMAAVVRHELREAATAERDRAAAKGTAVHEAAAAGKRLTEVGEDIAPYLAQYLDFLDKSGIEILAAECQVWNLTVGYAGSVDILGRFPNGSIWIVDIKTGKSIVAEHLLQQQPYLMAEFVGADDAVDEAATEYLRQATGVALLHLSEKDWEFINLEATAESWRAFRGLMAFGMWMQEHRDIESVTLATKKGSA